MHTRLSIHTSPILSLSFSRHIYVHSTIYSRLLLIINNCVKLQMILHLPLFLGNNMSMWYLEIQSDCNILLDSICCIQNQFSILEYDVYLSIIIHSRYTEKYTNNLIISAFLPSYSLFAFVSTHWNEQQTMMLKIRVMKKLSECDLCDLDINSLMRKNINKTENKY